MHPNPTKAPKPPTAVTAPFFPFLAMLLTARFKLPNGLVEPQQITFDFYRSLLAVGSNAVLGGYMGVARKRIPRDCITLKTVANSGLPSSDKAL